MTVRAAFVLIHRFVGLAIAGFLFLAGLTGAVISWDHELDELINPHLVEAPGRGTFLDPLVLADKLAADEPQSYVTYVPLLPEEGRPLPVASKEAHRAHAERIELVPLSVHAGTPSR